MPQSPTPHPPPQPPVPVLLLQLLSLAHPANCSPFAFGSSYRKQHFNRPHKPDSREGFRLRCCCLAILIEIGSNPCSHVVQQRGRPQVPYPPNSLASSRGPRVGAHTATELLIVFGDNPDRIRSEAAFAKRCGACPLPASSGMTTGRHRLNRGGHRQANAALYRAVIVRMRYHQPTVDDVARRTADGRTKREIIRCLKRFLAREIYQRVMTDFRARQELIQAA